MKANCIPKHAALGFTLIELLLGLAIIGILAGIALPAYNNYIDRSRAAAFLVQLDAWREKAAVETVASGADLCNWDEARFGKLRERIFGTTNTNPISFSDYQLEVTGRDPVGPGGPANRPFVVDVVATAGDGSRALNVARMIRQELERAGLRYISPATDRDLVSMQSFSAFAGQLPRASRHPDRSRHRWRTRFGRKSKRAGAAGHAETLFAAAAQVRPGRTAQGRQFGLRAQNLPAGSGTRCARELRGATAAVFAAAAIEQ